MKRSIFIVALLSLFTFSLSAQYARTFQRTTSTTLIRNTGSFSQDAQDLRPIKGQYIVQLKESYARQIAKTGEGDQLEIHLVQYSPGANCFSTMAIEYPYMFVQFEKPESEKVEFVIREEVVECD